MRPSNAHCLRLHEEPRFPRFAQPGQNKLRIHQSFHKLIQFVEDLEIFDHAKLLANGTLTILHKSSQTWILPKNKNKRTHQDFPTVSITQVCSTLVAQHPFLYDMDKLDARSGYPKSQRRNLITTMLPEEPSHGLMTVCPSKHQCCPAMVCCCPYLTSAPCCSSSWATATWPPTGANINAAPPAVRAAATSAGCGSNSWATASWPP
jgi:hypothetical protein